MSHSTATLTSSALEDINLYIEMGNEAIRLGDQEECIRWYIKGLRKAREQKNSIKESELSDLIITLI